MGYPTDLFIDTIPKQFLCIVCHDVLKYPVQCIKCESALCSKCFNSCKAQDDRCPMCRVANFQSKNLDKNLKQMMDVLKIKCLNMIHGCWKISELDFYEKHLKECDFLQIKCSNEGCEVEIFQMNKKKHDEECPFYRTECQRCKYKMTRPETPSHDCISQLEIQIKELQKNQKQQPKVQKQIYNLQQQLQSQQQINSQLEQNYIQLLEQFTFLETKFNQQAQKIQELEISQKTSKNVSLREDNTENWTQGSFSHIETPKLQFQRSQSFLDIGIDVNYLHQSIKAENNNKRLLFTSQQFQNAIFNFQLESNKIHKVKLRILKGKNIEIGVTKILQTQEGLSFTAHRSGWGFNLLNATLIHNQKLKSNYAIKVQPVSTIEMQVDTYQGSVQFSINGNNYGIAFQSTAFTDGQTWVAVSAVENCEVELLDYKQ